MSPSALLCVSTRAPVRRSAATTRRPMKPLAPVTRTASRTGEQRLPPRFELFDRLRVVVGPPEIEPVAVVRPDVDALPARNQRMHKIVEAERLPGWNDREHGFL